MASRWRCPPESVTPALADDRVVAILEAHDEVVGLRILGRLDDGLLGRLAAQPKGDVLADRAREEEDILLDGRDLRAQRCHVPVAHIDAVDQDAPAADVVDAVDQLGQRRLAGAGLADDGDGLARAARES